MTADDRLSLANRLLAAGVPVIVVNGKTDRPRQAWEDVRSADDCDLGLYRPGDALLMLGGHGLDIVDVDTKDGKEGSADHLPPFRSFGETTTPSGGRHLLVPSSGLGKVSPLRTEQGYVGDYCGGRPDGSGRLGAFLPGSQRAKYPKGEYVEAVKWDVEGCLAARPDPGLVEALECAGALRASPRDVYRDDTPFADAPHPYAVAAVEAELARLDACGRDGWDGEGWDDTHFKVACNLIEFGNSGWAGLDPDDLHERFLDRAASDDRFTVKHHEAKWTSALNRTDGGGRRPPERPLPEDDFDVIEAEPGDEDETAGGGWSPVDLTATVAGLLDGSITRPEPTIGDFGGGFLFYAGRINSVHGDSTGGKTWTALVTAKQELDKGETVVYVDLEDSPEGVVSRLIVDLGVSADVVRERFVYLHPDEPLGKAAALGLTALLAHRRPSLVVVDSTGEALAVEGANPNADEEVARWFRLLPRLAIRCGAAVLLLDHATKAGDNDLWPIGSQRKRAAVTGAAYLQKVAVPFGKEQDGKAVLICAKDRHGNYPLRRRVAALQVRGGRISLVAEASTGPQGEFRPTGYMEKVSRWLEGAGTPQSKNQAEKAGLGNKKQVIDALAALVADGHVAVQAGVRGALLHTVVRPYREDAGDDDLL